MYDMTPSKSTSQYYLDHGLNVLVQIHATAYFSRTETSDNPQISFYNI